MSISNIWSLLAILLYLYKYLIMAARKKVRLKERVVITLLQEGNHFMMMTKSYYQATVVGIDEWAFDRIKEAYEIGHTVIARDSKGERVYETIVPYEKKEGGL